MPDRLISPYPASPTAFYYTSKEMNAIQRPRYMDDFGFYQRLFRMYSYMTMNSRKKYVIHTPKGHPLMWQPYTSCSYSETGSLSIGKRELEPDPIYMKERFCHDVMMDSCYEHFIEYMADGSVGMTNEGQAAFTQFVEEVLTNAALGFRLSLTAGQLYDVDTVTFSPDNTANLTALFKRTHGTVRGWVKLFYDLAQEAYPWLDLNLTSSGDFDSDGTFTGNIVELFEALKRNAKKAFRSQINKGGTVQEGRESFLPLIILSDGYFQAVVDYYNAQAEKIAVNRVRITKRMFGGESSPTPNTVYYFDDMLPIIPLSDVNGFDPYIKGSTHFAGIVGSGNIQLGTSFGRVSEDVERRDIGVMVGYNDDMHSDTYQSYTVLSHALAKSALADPDFAVATINYTEPA